MGKEILIFPHLTILCGILMRFYIFNNDSAAVSALLIEEVCVPHEIAELERYLAEFDLPEVPISNTATYHFGSDDPEGGGSSRVQTLNENELLPFGALPVDWKRLRILRDLLVLPEDQELRSKLTILYKILIPANQRVRKMMEEKNRGENGSEDVEAAARSESKEIQGGSEIERRRIFSTGEIGNTKISSRGTTARQRLGRSTYKQNDGRTDSSMKIKDEEEELSASLSGPETTENFQAFSQPPETLDFGDINRARDPEGGEKFKNVIPQLEEVEGTFGDSKSKKEEEEEEEFFDGEEKNESIQTTDSFLEKTLADSAPTFVVDKSIEGEEARDYNQEEVTGFENPKVEEEEEEGGHVDSETINEMRSFRTETEERRVTTEEIKPDVEKEDLERIATLSLRPFTRSPLLLPIDQRNISAFNFGGKSYHSYRSSSPGYLGVNDDRSDRKFSKSKNGEEDSSGFSQPTEDPGIKRTRKTLILKIAESFSNVPRPVKMTSIKNGDQKGGNHLFGMQNFSNGKYQGAVSSPGQSGGQEFAGKLSANKSSSFGYFRRFSSPKGRQGKREGRYTDAENLYRWFYRGGEDPGKLLPRGQSGPEIICKRRNSTDRIMK